VTIPKKILLLDAYSTRTLACVRSFGAHGIQFVVGGHTRWDMSFYPRYCQSRFLYTPPYRSISQFLADIAAAIERSGADAVFPTSEAAILAFDSGRDKIPAQLIIPSRAEIETLFQKWQAICVAESVGVRVPKTRLITPENVDSLADSAGPFPAIIKANWSDSVSGDCVVRAGSTVYVYSADQLLAEAKKKLTRSPQILVQEFINGYGVGISGVFKNGEPVVLFGHRRIRESNPCGGPSAVALSIPVSEELRQAAVQIMRKTGYSGPAMVEFKTDRRTQTPYFMEVNARLWGSILLTQAAGLDLPYLMWKSATGQNVGKEETGYREGVVGRNLLGDTRHLVSVLRGRPKNWPGEFPGRVEALRDYLSLFAPGRSKHLLFTQDDPKPAFGRLLQELLARHAH